MILAACLRLIVDLETIIIHSSQQNNKTSKDDESIYVFDLRLWASVVASCPQCKCFFQSHYFTIYF